jgi:hypothetical protein
MSIDQENGPTTPQIEARPNHRAAPRRRNLRHDLGYGGRIGGFGWARLFESRRPARRAASSPRRIDAKLHDPLTGLPSAISDGRPSLIDYNLTRGARLLPSGRGVTAHMGAEMLSDADLALPGGGPAPLWCFEAKEALCKRNAITLGRSAAACRRDPPRASVERLVVLYAQRAEPEAISAIGHHRGLRQGDLTTFTGHGLNQRPTYRSRWAPYRLAHPGSCTRREAAF